VAGKHASSMKRVAAGSAADCKLAVYRCEPNAALSALYGALVANLAVHSDSCMPPLEMPHQHHLTHPLIEECPTSWHSPLRSIRLNDSLTDLPTPAAYLP